MTTTTDSPGNGFASIPNDLDGIERLCEQLYTAQDSGIRKHAESVLFPLSSNPRHLSQGTMILENAKVCSLMPFPGLRTHCRTRYSEQPSAIVYNHSNNCKSFTYFHECRKMSSLFVRDLMPKNSLDGY